MTPKLNKRSQRGFSLTEMCIACMVMATMAAIAIPMIDNSIRRSKADAAAQLIAQQFAYARSLAIGNHQPVLVQFGPFEQTIAVAPTTDSVRGPFVLPGRMQLQSNAIPPETPDNLGGNVLGAGDAAQLYFLDNGSAVDAIASNNILSGTVFLQHENGDAATRRAITVLGGTGRIHIWRYDTDTNSWK
jgi:prepilin-type N-terminal cleavage/methylation domain-containing protein